MRYVDFLNSDLASSNDDLRGRTQPGVLGECTAFMSHSWRDDAAAKWHTLSSWANAYAAAHNGSPLLWFDRACLDQQNIDESLSMLPIYLSGCKLLLILAGETYTTRLWCVMEVFTWLSIAPNNANLMSVLPLVSPIDSADGSASDVPSSSAPPMVQLAARAFTGTEMMQVVAAKEKATEAGEREVAKEAVVREAETVVGEEEERTTVARVAVKAAVKPLSSAGSTSSADPSAAYDARAGSAQLTMAAADEQAAAAETRKRWKGKWRKAKQSLYQGAVSGEEARKRFIAFKASRVRAPLESCTDAQPPNPFA